MLFRAFFSSSKSNFYVVTAANGKRMLIECGCTWKQLQRALDHDLSNIAGCLVSHEHLDHSKAIENILQAEIDVYSSAGTFEALGVVHRRAHVIEELVGISIADAFYVFPFNIIHDAVEPFGFVIQESWHVAGNQGSLLFVTDTSHIKQKFGLAFSIICICCNYDGDLLCKRVDSGDINEEFAKRLLTSHMEKKETLRYIKEFCNLKRCTEIHLLHMSQNNIEAEKVRKEFEDELSVKTFIAGGR